MQLEPGQIDALKSWAESGMSLSVIQKKLEDDFSVRMTYMDLRFLMDDLEIDIVTPKKPEPVEEPADADGAAAEKAEPAGVSVDMDPIPSAGTVISGGVTFSDGVSAKWYLDQMGRLGLDAADKTYRPSDEDLKDFQMQLRTLLQRRGF